MYNSKNYTVMIISTGNVPEVRAAIRNAIYHWNEINSAKLGITFIASGYDLNMRSDSGDRPQASINTQIVEKSDFAFAVFWNKIGQETGEYPSGSAEEIDLHLKAGKKVFVYFSKIKVDPYEIDPEQLQKLQDYKKEIGKISVNYKEFDDIKTLESKINDDLTLFVHDLDVSKIPSEAKEPTGHKKDKPASEVDINYSIQRSFQYGGVPEINRTFDTTIPSFKTQLNNSTKEVIINYIYSRLQMAHRDFFDIIKPMKLLDEYFDFIQPNQLKVFEIVLDEYIDYLRDSTYSFGAIEYTKNIFERITKEQYKVIRNIYIYKMLFNFSQLYKTNGVIKKFMDFTSVDEDCNDIEKEVRSIIISQIDYSKHFPLSEEDRTNFDKLNKRLDEIEDYLKPKGMFD